ncbi:MAG: hypothetical protein KJI72_01555, partial [Patescibacteria group bacterium]|nr:hypothetical protein [Patescibacteria group bacterium]
WFAVLSKTDTIWLSKGSAIYYTLQSHYGSLLGQILLSFPSFLKVLNYFTLGAEFFGSVVLFFPFFAIPIRTIAMFLLIIFQIGISLTMKLDLFPFIAIVAVIPFLPSWFWNKIFKDSRAHPRTEQHYSRLMNLGNTVAGVFLILVLLNSLGSIHSTFRGVRESWITKLFHLNQSWTLFAPTPPLSNTSYSIIGNLKDGGRIEFVGDGNTISYNKYWKKYLSRLSYERHKKLRPYLGKYLCETWNDDKNNLIKHGLLASLEVYSLRKKIFPYYEMGPTKERLIFNYDCGSHRIRDGENMR